MNKYATIKPLVIAMVFSLPALAAAEEHGAHVHGAAKLQVAIDASHVTLMLESPMDSLVGFEHAPGNAAEKAALATLVAALQKPESLFVFSPAAGCVSSSVKLESPLLAEDKHEEKHEAAGGEHGAHSDLDGEFVFQCSAPDKLEALTVNLFDIAANLQDLDVSVAGPRGQKGAELGSRQRTMAF
jgi:hypothetical protein